MKKCTNKRKAQFQHRTVGQLQQQPTSKREEIEESRHRLQNWETFVVLFRLAQAHVSEPMIQQSHDEFINL